MSDTQHGLVAQQCSLSSILCVASRHLDISGSTQRQTPVRKKRSSSFFCSYKIDPEQRALDSRRPPRSEQEAAFPSRRQRHQHRSKNRGIQTPPERADPRRTEGRNNHVNRLASPSILAQKLKASVQRRSTFTLDSLMRGRLQCRLWKAVLLAFLQTSLLYTRAQSILRPLRVTVVKAASSFLLR